MRKSPLLFPAGFALAMALTFSCSSDDGDGNPAVNTGQQAGHGQPQPHR